MPSLTSCLGTLRSRLTIGTRERAAARDLHCDRLALASVTVHPRYDAHPWIEAVRGVRSKGRSSAGLPRSRTSLLRTAARLQAPAALPTRDHAARRLPTNCARI